MPNAETPGSPSEPDETTLETYTRTVNVNEAGTVDVEAMLLDASSPVGPSTAIGLPEIHAAFLESRDLSRERWSWGAKREVPVKLPDPFRSDPEEIRSCVRRASAMGRSDITVSLPGVGGDPVSSTAGSRLWELGDEIIAVPDSRTIASGWGSTGIGLASGELWHPALADLADDVARAFDAHTTISVIIGRVSVSSLQTRARCTPAVVCLAGSCSVTARMANGVEVVEVSEGFTRRFDAITEIDAGLDGVALVVGIVEPTIAELWTIMAASAGWWPRMRAGLPNAPSDVCAVYGTDEPVIAIDAVRTLLTDELLTLESAERSLAWWRGNILAASRPIALSRSISELRDSPLRVQGHLPGGLGFITNNTGGGSQRCVASSWVFELPDGAIDLARALVHDELVPWADLSDIEATFAAKLITLGLAGNDKP